MLIEEFFDHRGIKAYPMGIEFLRAVIVQDE